MINLAQHGYTHKQAEEFLRTRWLDKMRFRVDVIRGNAFVKTLNLESFRFNCDSQAEVKYSGSFVCEDTPLDSNRDMLQPIMYVDDLGERFEYRFVPLMIISVRPHMEYAKTITIDGMDTSFVLQNSSIGEVLFVPKGTSYTGLIDKLIKRVGFDYTSVTPSDKLFLYDREDWQAGDKYLKVINTLAGEINYRTLEVGLDGMPKVRPYVMPDITGVNIEYSAERDSIILPEKNIEYDRWGIPNVFIGEVFTSEMEKPLRVVYENTNSSDPTSLVNNKYRLIYLLEKVDNVADIESLDGIVRRTANEMTTKNEIVDFTTAVMPHHEVGEVIALTADGVTGIWEELSWSITISQSDRSMSHKVRRVY